MTTTKTLRINSSAHSDRCAISILDGNASINILEVSLNNLEKTSAQNAKSIFESTQIKILLRADDGSSEFIPLSLSTDPYSSKPSIQLNTQIYSKELWNSSAKCLMANISISSSAKLVNNEEIHLTIEYLRGLAKIY